MATWFTADTHFGHRSIIRLCSRPFKDVREMDETMIARWNGVVGDDDVVYHLGDLTLGTKRRAWHYLRQLHGHIVLVPGSHDRRWTRGLVGVMRDGATGERDVLVAHDLTRRALVPGQPDVVLCHYAMRVWPKSHYGAFHLYGHSHGRLPGVGRSMDVGVDCHDFRPVSLQTVVERLSAVPIPTSQHMVDLDEAEAETHRGPDEGAGP